MSKRETLVNASEITRGFYTKAGVFHTVDPGDEVTVSAEDADRLKAVGFKKKPEEKKAKKPKATATVTATAPVMAPEAD